MTSGPELAAFGWLMMHALCEYPLLVPALSAVPRALSTPPFASMGDEI